MDIYLRDYFDKDMHKAPIAANCALYACHRDSDSELHLRAGFDSSKYKEPVTQ